jgi:hypothetical protein
MTQSGNFWTDHRRTAWTGTTFSPLLTAAFRLAHGLFHVTLINYAELHGAVLEKLTVAQLIKKLDAFYGTRRLMTIFI